MRHIKLFENFGDEKLYRNTSIKWLIDLLTHGSIEPYKSGIKLPSNKRFISFSEREDSGGQDNFGDVCIEFDAQKLYDQGAIAIDYDTDFFDVHPDICMYVTGYTGEDQYYKANDYDDKEDYENNGREDANTISWESNIDDYSEEAEVVIKKLKYEEGLITRVILPVRYKNTSKDPHIAKELEIIHQKKINIEINASMAKMHSPDLK